jgi:hypothetical protein
VDHNHLGLGHFLDGVLGAFLTQATVFFPRVFFSGLEAGSTNHGHAGCSLGQAANGIYRRLCECAIGAQIRILALPGPTILIQGSSEDPHLNPTVLSDPPEKH